MTPHPLTAFLDARLTDMEDVADRTGPALVAWLTYHEQPGSVYWTTVAAREDTWDSWVANGKDLPDPDSVRTVYDPAQSRRTAAALCLILTAHAESDGECRGCKPAYGDCYPQWPCDTVLAVAAIWENDPGYQAAITAIREPEPPEPRKPEPVTCAGICGKAPVVSETILIQHAGWQRTRFGMMCPTCIADWLEWCEQRQPMY